MYLKGNNMEKQILIVEDDIVSGRILESILNNLGLKSLGIINKVEEALIIVKELRPDIVFMDIDLSSSMDGIYTAEIITSLYNIPVIFVTSFDDTTTIRRAMSIGSGYVTKPFFESDIKIILNDIEKKLKRENIRSKCEYECCKLAVKSGSGIVFISFQDIVFVEAKGHTLLIRTDNQEYRIRRSLKAILESDHDKIFFRCHKSFLVNKGSISGLIKDRDYNYLISLKNSDIRIPITRDKVKYLRSYNV